ncbi:hypothetical protein GPECTOR_15g453 [Gonium pectorale]|uniref:Uncharacterized protein n=1 Tax=Gonium pectorale TaxID=33097 RepID=A0A150GLW9_GONPE|nr:hypothetical protein GPECTOR_15g453 [Gonium pectorale]|eukprot:KXZ50768.1 hypothetical protein GPECTOR_15g453 [Gonium pectorale]
MGSSAHGRAFRVAARSDPTSGVRGLYLAEAAVAAGEVLAAVPLEAAVALGSAEQTAPRDLASAKREWMRAVWAGEGAGGAVRLPLARALPRRAVSLAEFA